MVSAMTTEISVGLPLGIEIFEIIATRRQVLPHFQLAPRQGDTTMDTVLNRTETRRITSRATETRLATRETNVYLLLDHRRPLYLADHLPLRLAGTAFGLPRGTSPSVRINPREFKKTHMTHIVPMVARTDLVQADPTVATVEMIAAARVYDPRTVGLLLPSASC